jgi:chromosome partitioning protein
MLDNGSNQRGGQGVRTIAVFNQKGGVAKTTTAINLAIGLARRLPKGKRLLLVDGDSQGNCSLTMQDGKQTTGPTIGDVLLDDVDIVEAIRPSRVPGVDLLPSHASLADATLLLTDQLGREQRLKGALREVESRYEVVVIDSPPRLDLVSVNILNAVGEILVPVDAGIYGASGLGQLQTTVERVRRHLNHADLKITGLLITRAMTNRATKDFEDQLRESYGPLVFKSVIPYDVRVEESHARHRSVLEHAPKSRAAVAYDLLIGEVLKHGKTRNARRSHRRDDAA